MLNSSLLQSSEYQHPWISFSYQFRNLACKLFVVLKSRAHPARICFEKERRDVERL